jgi:hypothetical protein
MSILKWTTFKEIVAAITDQPGGEVEIALAGYESKYRLAIPTREVAIADLRAAADWLESEDENAR